ncbi:MAG: crossover junction endodeoxyribonuclease RuvC, partial [Acidobacteria bacterium]|nr:crossover junction endodeoxyribonuclease RuvC [Acidobacteriota bacterium]
SRRPGDAPAASMRVLGIDPSLRSTGFGIVDEEGGRLVPVAYGIIAPTAKNALPQKLAEIKAEIEGLIRAYAPAEAAIENAFYAQNMKTALTLGQVRGAVLVAVAETDKDQVLTMVRSLLGLADDDVPLDASDALAAAICHLNARQYRAKIDSEDAT